jgi:hypothetical protein
MNDVMGWATIVIVLSIPVVFAGVGFSMRRRQSSDTHSQLSSGGLLGFDELFHPSAHEARIVWEAEQEIPVPAPTPDKGPGIIEADRRIVVSISDSAAQSE